MSQEIHIYGGKIRRGSITLVPTSTEARNLLGENKLFTAYLSEFPEIKYSTQWGEWDKSNSAFIANKVASFAGAGDGIPGKIVRMLAGDKYVAPVLTDQWTQLSATLGDGTYMELELSIIVYPILNNEIKVEGLTSEDDNMIEIINETTSMFSWIDLAKNCLMPNAFTSDDIRKNLIAVMTNFYDKNATTGKYELTSRGKRIVGGIKELGGGIFELNPQKAIHGAENAFQAIVNVKTDSIGQRIGPTFEVLVRDTNNDLILNSASLEIPVDFFIKEMGFKFSPHIVRITNDKGVVVGSCPEFCEITIAIQSVCKLLPSQIVQMCKR